MSKEFPAITPETQQFTTVEAGKNELSKELIRNTIFGLEEAMLRVPEAQKLALETMHQFLPGVYVRTVFMAAGSLITGKIHRQEHVVIVSQGSATVMSEEWGEKRLQAPAIFVSPPEVKRLLFIHSDMIFTTVHPNPTNTRDTALLEKELIFEHYEEKTQAEEKKA